MSLHERHEKESFFDYKQEDKVEELSHRKEVRRLLEEKLERKRLKEEFKDDFDELGGEFDWDQFEL